MPIAAQPVAAAALGWPRSGAAGASASATDSGVNAGDRGELRQHRRADGEVAGQAVDRALQHLRHQQPAQPPARSSRSTSKSCSPPRHLATSPTRSWSRARPGYTRPWYTSSLISRTPVDLAPRRDRGQFLGRDHRAGRVGRAGDDHALHRRIESRRASAAVGWNRVSGPHGHLDHLTAQRRQDVAVARVAGTGDRHAVADVEARQERQQETAAGTGRHHHVVGVDDEAVPGRRRTRAIASRSSGMPSATV